MHLAAMHDNKELVELLLERGASCKDRDKVSQGRMKLQRQMALRLRYIERGIEVAMIEIVS